METTVRARTQLKLFTGGKGRIGRQDLLCINAWAETYGKPPRPNPGMPWLDTPSTPVPPQQIQIRGKALGNDGKLWLVLPDNFNTDLNLIAPGRHYGAWASVEKYHPFIRANGINLEETTPEFCVGQKVTFSLDWSDQHSYSGIPAGLQSNYCDWVASAKCVNTNWYRTMTFIENGIEYTVSYGAPQYANNPDLWRIEQPHAWWYSGGLKNVGVNLTIYFENGQTVSWEAATKLRGKFRMLKPFVTRLVARGPFAAGIELTGLLPRLSLMNGPMVFDVYISKTYPGKLGITQLVNMLSQTVIPLPPYFIWHSTFGSFWLDGNEFYDEIPVNLATWPSDGEFPTPSSIYDMPGQTLGIVMGSYNGHWKDYVRFTPVGNDSIPITLARIEWRWAATANEIIPRVWVVTSDGVDGPVLYEDDSFPDWTNVFPAPRDDSP